MHDDAYSGRLIPRIRQAELLTGGANSAFSAAHRVFPL
jgi:hypothetical protein